MAVLGEPPDKLPIPIVFTPSLNDTEPVAEEVTVAVKVTGFPYDIMGDDEVTLVAEAIAVIVSVPFTN